MLAIGYALNQNEGMHVLTANQFNQQELGSIFERADYFKEQVHSAEGRRSLFTLHQGEQIASIFYEPSTRTKASFELAALKLGMGVFETEHAGSFSSISKGETIEDTVRVLGSYGLSAIVLRTNKEGMAARAASASEVPVINGGDGKGEHPTQSLLDAYTIHDVLGRLDGLKVVMGGDLRRGRTVRSLSQLLAKYPGNKITFVSIPALQIGDDIKTHLDSQGVEYDETTEMYDPLHDADVVYWTRLQRERKKEQDEPGSEADGQDEPDGEAELDRQAEEQLRALPEGSYDIGAAALQALSDNAIIMHPLPRVGEIHRDVDDDPRAKYFEQAENGLYVRMALLDRAANLRQ
jgi:aspartate carbamoyltransferase catalytic subunit